MADALQVVPVNPRDLNRHIYVWARRPSDFAVLEHNFQLDGTGSGPRVEREAREYIARLKASGYSQFRAEFRIHSPITLGVIDAEGT
jgi:hypothetical protein